MKSLTFNNERICNGMSLKVEMVFLKHPVMSVERVFFEKIVLDIYIYIYIYIYYICINIKALTACSRPMLHYITGGRNWAS